MLYGGRQQFEGLADHHVPPYPQPAIAPGFGPLPPDYGLAPPFVAAAYGSNVVMEQRLPSAGWLSSVNDLARFASALDSYDVGSDMVAENGTVILERSWVTEMLTSNLPFDFNQRLGWDRRASTTTPPVNNPGSLPSRGLTPPGVNLNAYFKWGGTTGTRALVYHRVDGLNIAFSFNRLGAGADGLRDALAEAANWILYA
jgi:hypothetical protein